MARDPRIPLDLAYEYKGYRITGRRPRGFDKLNRATGEIDVVGYDEEADKPAGWKATVRYLLDVADVKLLKVTFEPLDGDDIKSSDWKRFVIGDIRKYLRATFAERPELASMPMLIADSAVSLTEDEKALILEQRKRAEEAAEVLRTHKPKRGPGAKNEEHWCAVTDVYLYCVRRWGPKGVYKRMVDEFFEREEIEYTEEKMKWWVERARKYEFLQRAGGRGKVGGDYGPAYTEWKERQK